MIPWFKKKCFVRFLYPFIFLIEHIMLFYIPLKNMKKNIKQHIFLVKNINKKD